MDNTAPIVPTFTGQLGLSAAALCDFFLILAEENVPVTKIVIVAGGKKHKFPVESGKYKMALFLLYCAVLRKSPSFVFDSDDVLRQLLVPYFGNEIVKNAQLPETSHPTLRLLILGTDVRVSLVLKPGYELPKNPGRTLHKLIEYGWSQRRHLDRNTLAPLIRQALQEFQAAKRRGTLHIIPSWDSRIWPSDPWQDRVWTLRLQLNIRDAA